MSTDTVESPVGTPTTKKPAKKEDHNLINEWYGQKLPGLHNGPSKKPTKKAVPKVVVKPVKKTPPKKVAKVAVKKATSKKASLFVRGASSLTKPMYEILCGLRKLKTAPETKEVGYPELREATGYGLAGECWPPAFAALEKGGYIGKYDREEGLRFAIKAKGLKTLESAEKAFKSA
jgi:hypothetical protein